MCHFSVAKQVASSLWLCG